MLSQLAQVQFRLSWRIHLHIRRRLGLLAERPRHLRRLTRPSERHREIRTPTINLGVNRSVPFQTRGRLRVEVGAVPAADGHTPHSIRNLQNLRNLRNLGNVSRSGFHRFHFLRVRQILQLPDLGVRNESLGNRPDSDRPRVGPKTASPDAGDKASGAGRGTVGSYGGNGIRTKDR